MDKKTFQEEQMVLRRFVVEDEDDEEDEESESATDQEKDTTPEKNEVNEESLSKMSISVSNMGILYQELNIPLKRMWHLRSTKASYINFWYFYERNRFFFQLEY